MSLTEFDQRRQKLTRKTSPAARVCLLVCTLKTTNNRNIFTTSDHLAEENKDDYTRWVNYFKPNLVKEDIVTELADGIKLITLVNTLTGQNLVRRSFYFSAINASFCSFPKKGFRCTIRP